LITFEELFNGPSLRIIEREVLHFISIMGAEKSFKVAVLGMFAFTLDGK
jgi:hypothetical protein